jgi:hypothetical protein
LVQRQRQNAECESLTNSVMDNLKKLIIDIELPSVEGIGTCFQNGINPNDLFRDEPLIDSAKYSIRLP